MGSYAEKILPQSHKEHKVNIDLIICDFNAMRFQYTSQRLFLERLQSGQVICIFWVLRAKLG